MQIAHQLIQLYSFLIFGRVILSWFPITRGGAMEQIYSVLYSVTEPVLGPVRRTLPAMGGLDLSPIVVIIGLELLGSAIH